MMFETVKGTKGLHKRRSGNTHHIDLYLKKKEKMKNYRIAVVPGDGIGHEIVPAGLKVVKAVGKLYQYRCQL